MGGFVYHRSTLALDRKVSDIHRGIYTLDNRIETYYYYYKTLNRLGITMTTRTTGTAELTTLAHRVP